jgi:hypothetical protein
MHGQLLLVLKRAKSLLVLKRAKSLHFRCTRTFVGILDLWFNCFWLSSEKYKIISWNKKEFEDIEDLLVFSRLLLCNHWSQLMYLL